jgi:hypothetical protein
LGEGKPAAQVDSTRVLLPRDERFAWEMDLQEGVLLVFSVSPGPCSAVKDFEAGLLRYVAVRSANVRIFAERKATYLRTVQRQNT